MEMIHIWVKNAADLSENAGNQTDSCKMVSSLREARDIVRTLLAGGAAGEITVHLTPGLYDPTDFVFGEEDCSPDCDSIEECVRQHILVYVSFSSFCQGCIMS